MIFAHSTVLNIDHWTEIAPPLWPRHNTPVVAEATRDASPLQKQKPNSSISRSGEGKGSKVLLFRHPLNHQSPTHDLVRTL